MDVSLNENLNIVCFPDLHTVCKALKKIVLLTPASSLGYPGIFTTTLY